jgi:hypothetical protein
MLKKNEAKLHPAKKTKIKPGFSPGNMPLIIGKKNITIKAPIQFIIVEYGIIFGWTISGIYNQTTGPSESPKLAKNNTSPPIINTFESSTFDSLIKHPIAIIPFDTNDPKHPACKIVLLPSLESRKDVAKAAKTC